MGTQERKEREKQQRRQAIIQAAEEIFFSRGFDQTTMDEVAAGAELSKGTLYLYFSSKEELYYAVYRRGQEMLYNMVDKQLKGLQGTRQKINAVIDAIILFRDQHPDYFEAFYYFLTHSFSLDENNPLVRQGRETDHRYLQLWVTLVEEGKKEGVIDHRLEAVDLVLLLWTNLIGFLKIYQLNGGRLERLFSTSRQRLLNTFKELFFRGIAP